MHGSLNALGMLAMIGYTVWACRRNGHNPTSPGQGVIQGVIGAFVALFAFSAYYLFHVKGYDGSYSIWWADALIIENGHAYPIVQSIWCALCAGTICYHLTGYKLFSVHTIHIGFIVCCALVLGLYFNWILVQRESDQTLAYTDLSGTAAKITRARQDEFQEELGPWMSIYLGTRLSQRYPPGWLAKSTLWDGTDCTPDHRDNMYPIQPACSGIIRTHWHWYTPLTGLVTVDYPETGIWYPGGRLADGVQKLELRPMTP